MNEFESIESRLRELAPRQPSAAISRRLFRETAIEPQAIAGLFSSLGQWLVPVTGCLLLAVSSIAPHASTKTESGWTLAADGKLGGGRAYMSAMVATHCEQNNLPRTSLEWSLGAPDLSLPLPQPVTNTLRH